MTACAKDLTPEQITPDIKKNDFSRRSNLKWSVYVEDVANNTGKEDETLPFSLYSLKSALENSLAELGFLSSSRSSAKYVLHAAIEKMDQRGGTVGLQAAAAAGMTFRLESAADKSVLWSLAPACNTAQSFSMASMPSTRAVHSTGACIRGMLQQAVASLAHDTRFDGTKR